MSPEYSKLLFGHFPTSTCNIHVVNSCPVSQTRDSLVRYYEGASLSPNRFTVMFVSLGEVAMAHS